MPSTAAPPAGRRPRDGDAGCAERSGAVRQRERRPSDGRISGTGRSIPTTGLSTGEETAIGSAPSSGRRRDAAEPRIPRIPMSIKGSPGAGSPATVRAATPSSWFASPWRRSTAIAAPTAGRPWVTTRRFWPSCATGGPTTATTGGRSPAPGPVHRPVTLRHQLLAFEVIASAFLPASLV